MPDYEGIVSALDERSNLYNELVTRELQIIWEHSFQNVPPDAGNGITDKFFEYSSGVSRDGPDVVIPEGEFIRTKERGDYGAGQPVVTGAAGKFTQEPIADQDGYLGYYDSGAGIGYGAGYAYFDGTGPATSAGAQPYAFNERDGEGREIVPQEDWNLNKLNGEDGEGPEFDPTDGFTLRLPHACYGHTASVVAIGVKKDLDADLSPGGGLRRVSDAFEVYPVHAFTAPGETMWVEFDLPVTFETTGTQDDGFAFAATACHYEGETGRENKRTNGEAWSPVKNGGNTLTVPPFPEWTYVMAFRKRGGWETADVTPQFIKLAGPHDMEVQLTVGADLSNTAWALPADTSDTECATEYDLSTWDLTTDSQKSTNTTVNDRGEREFIDVVPGGKQSPIDVMSQLQDVVLTGQETIAMFVRRAEGASNTAVEYAAMRNGGGF